MIIILGGQFRGNENSWNSIEAFREKNNAKVFVGSYEPNDWRSFPIVHNITKTFYLYDTFINSDIYDIKRHRHQYSSLYLTYNFFKDLIEENEVIVKLRNDFILSDDIDLDFNSLNENSIYTPSIEFHMSTPFDTENVCNDQILVGKKTIMDKYFNFPYDFIYDKSYMMSIEESLREYLKQQKITLNTFNWTYKKI